MLGNATLKMNLLHYKITAMKKLLGTLQRNLPRKVTQSENFCVAKNDQKIPLQFNYAPKNLTDEAHSQSLIYLSNRQTFIAHLLGRSLHRVAINIQLMATKETVKHSNIFKVMDY